MSYKEIFSKTLNKPLLSEELKRELKESILFDVKNFLNSEGEVLNDKIRNLLLFQKEKEIKKNYEKLLDLERKYLKYITLEGVDYDNLSLKIVPCTTENEMKLWNYARTIVSSAPNRGYIGRICNFLVFDENSDKLLGIIGLGSDFIRLPIRDKYIGVEHLRVNKELRYKYIQFLLNMYVCVSVEPFSMLTGGKLLALLASSNFIRDYYVKKYENPLFGITTTSLYGKSIQYDRLWDPKSILARWKYLGLTRGNATTLHFSPKTRKLINKAIKQLGVVIPSMQSRPLTTKLTIILNQIGLKREEVFPEKCLHKRGVYFCWLIKEQNIFKQNLEKFTYIDRPVEDIFRYWKKRWFERRYEKYKDKLKPKDYSLPKKEKPLSFFSKTDMEEAIQLEFVEEGEIKFEFEDEDIKFEFIE